MKKRLFPVRLLGRVYQLAELGVDQLLLVYRDAGTETGETAQLLATSMAGLRYSLRSIDGAPVVYADLLGRGLDERLKPREVIALGQVWTQIHEPSAEALEAARASLAVTAGAAPNGRDRYAVTLADGRVAVLDELGISDIQVATRVGGKERARQAASLRIGLEGLRHSLVSIEGAPVNRAALAELTGWSDLLRAADVALLCAIWNDIHLGEAGAAAELGEES